MNRGALRSFDHRVPFQLDGEITMLRPVTSGTWLEGTVRCKDGADTRIESFHLNDVSMLGVDETAHVQGYAFGSAGMTRRPRSCNVKLELVGATTWGAGSRVDLGHWCLSGSSTKKC